MVVVAVVVVVIVIVVVVVLVGVVLVGVVVLGHLMRSRAHECCRPIVFGLLGIVRGKACHRARAHVRNLDVVGLGQHARNRDVVYRRAGKRFGNTSWLSMPATSFMYGAAWQKGVVCDRSTLCL